jgi:hypothetical protein
MSMTIVRASCPICGDVELIGTQVRLVTSNIEERSHYSFTCPTCGDLVRKPAPLEVQRLLMAGGIHPERLEVPAEALERHHGPSLDWDDLMDFQELLDSDTDLLEAVERAVRGIR